MNHFCPSLCLTVSHPINRLNIISPFHPQSSLLFSSQILCIFFVSPTFALSNLVVIFFLFHCFEVTVRSQAGSRLQMRYVVNKVAIGQVSVRVLRSFLSIIIALMLITDVH
jgi:hypothetical protein